MRTLDNIKAALEALDSAHSAAAFAAAQMMLRDRLEDACNPTAILELLAYVESLERDAERYRWLRTQPYETWKKVGWNTWRDHPSVFPNRDAAIDAAMEQTK